MAPTAAIVDSQSVKTPDQAGERGYGKLRLEIVRRCDPVKGFKVLPKRWIVERTFGWLSKSRRLCRDYEVRLDHSEAMARITMIRLMVRRLAAA